MIGGTMKKAFAILALAIPLPLGCSGTQHDPEHDYDWEDEGEARRSDNLVPKFGGETTASGRYACTDDPCTKQMYWDRASCDGGSRRCLPGYDGYECCPPTSPAYVIP